MTNGKAPKGAEDAQQVGAVAGSGVTDSGVVGPMYDCGDPDCTECRCAFGPDRRKAIANFEAREIAYAALAKKERAQ